MFGVLCNDIEDGRQGRIIYRGLSALPELKDPSDLPYSIRL
jgi:predicted RecA/RadA family phage recombinase